MLWPAIVIAVSAWWLLTGLALLLVHQSKYRTQYAFILVSMFALAAWLLLPLNAQSTTPIGVAMGFLLGLVVWGWLEISYLLGYVNGPNHDVCELGVSTWERFKGALATTIYHETAVVATLLLLVIISWGQPNPTALYTVTVLGVMRWSAKLNLFFGVRAFNERWLPEHLHYLVSYLKIDKSSWLLPVSSALGFYVTFLLFDAAQTVPMFSQQLTMYLIASLMLLASIEHIFLLFPINEAILWRWAKQDFDDARVMKQKDR